MFAPVSLIFLSFDSSFINFSLYTCFLISLHLFFSFCFAVLLLFSLLFTLSFFLSLSSSLSVLVKQLIPFQAHGGIEGAEALRLLSLSLVASFSSS